MRIFTHPLLGGERGIRTPGTSQYNGFQDRRNRPLCHLSRTSFEKRSFSKAMQRYDLFLNLQMFRGNFSKKTSQVNIFPAKNVRYVDSNPLINEPMDMNRMKKNAEKIMEVMKLGYKYTLSKLEEITLFGSTELCMAILVLIRDKRVRQFQCEEGVCYVLVKA